MYENTIGLVAVVLLCGQDPLYVINGNLNAVRYADSILRPMVLPCLRGIGQTFLQDDTVGSHGARVVTEFLSQNVKSYGWNELHIRLAWRHQSVSGLARYAGPPAQQPIP